MKKSVMIIVVILLSASFVLASAPMDSGDTTTEEYTNALLPDVYVAEVTVKEGDSISIYNINFTYFPLFYRIYPMDMKDSVETSLKNGTLPDEPDDTFGDVLLYVFAYMEPDVMVFIGNDVKIIDFELVIKSEVSFYLYSGQYVKLTTGTLNEDTIMCIGIGDFVFSVDLKAGTNEFFATAPDEWRIYDRNYHSATDVFYEYQIFMTFSIEIGEMPVNSAVPGYAMLIIGIACIGLFFISVRKQIV